MPTTTLAEFAEAFRLPELVILRTEHWTWSVRPIQSTLGAGVLSLNRYATSLSDMTVEEASGLAHATRAIQSTLEQFSAPEKMNYLSLMMVDAHLHFHVIPRYSAPRTFAGQTWVDEGWPALPVLGGNAAISAPESLTAIRDEMIRLLPGVVG